MGREKKIFIIGRKGELKKTLMIFTFSEKTIVWSWSEPRNTMDGRNDPVDIHRTYHESGEIITSSKTKGHIHHSEPVKSEPLSKFKGPVLFGVAHGHYLDFEGFQIKCFDPRRAVTVTIIMDIQEGNYLGFKVMAFLLDKESNEESTIHFKQDDEEVYIVRIVNPWLKLIIKRLHGMAHQ